MIGSACIFFPSKGLLFFYPPGFLDLSPVLLDHTMRTLFFLSRAHEYPGTTEVQKKIGVGGAVKGL